MGITIRIRGRYGNRLPFLAPDGAAFLQDVEAWWRRHHAPLLIDTDRDDSGLGISIHPGAENVVFSVPRRGHVAVEAKTSTAGPGYHMFVCDALHALGGELGVRWDPLHEESLDEGFYFYTRNPSDVHEEMRNFIRNLATHALHGFEDHVLQFSMRSQWRFEVPDANVLTPLGPRDRDWLEGAAADGARAIDIFPWWHRGAGAHYWLGRAQVQMWSDVRWREPFTDEQRDVLRDVHGALTAAYRAEPRLTYPWREWLEIAEWLGVDDDTLREHAARAADAPRIGYRRHDVTTRVSEEWSVRVPGAFAYDWDDETWVAWEPGRWVRVRTFRREAGGALETAARKTRAILDRETAEEIALAGGGTAAYYRSRDAEGQESWVLQSLVAGDDRSLALCTIVFDDETHRDWAVATRQSLHWAEPPEPRTVVVGGE